MVGCCRGIDVICCRGSCGFLLRGTKGCGAEGMGA